MTTGDRLVNEVPTRRRVSAVSTRLRDLSPRRAAPVCGLSAQHELVLGLIDKLAQQSDLSKRPRGLILRWIE